MTKFPVLLVCWTVLLTTLMRGVESTPAPLPPGARFAVEHFGDRFGLGAITVTALAQDHQGFLWIGTQTGLLRYDGSRVRRFDEVEKITSHYIEQLLIGPDGTLWVKGGNGIAHLVQGQFEAVPIPREAGKIAEGFQFFTVDSANNVFVTVESGLARINSRDPSDSRLFTKENALPGAVFAITRANDDSVWFVAGNRIGRFRPQAANWELLPITGMPNDRIVALQFDGYGTLWLRTIRHVARLNPESQKMVLDDRGVPPANIDGLPSIDEAGELLLPTVAGLYHRLNNEWRAITDKQGLSSNSIVVAFEDKDGIVWVAGMGTGLDRLIGIDQWFAWTKNEGLPDWLVWSEARDHQGRLWVATSGGLGLWDGHISRWRVFTDKDGLGGPEIRQLAVAGDGAMWTLSRMGGITRIDPLTFQMNRLKTITESGLPAFRSIEDPRFFYIKSAPDGQVWASGHDFLVRFDPSSPVPKPVPVKVLPEMKGAFWTISFSKSGILWLSGAWGAGRFDGNKWRVFTAQDGLLAPPSIVLATGDDEVWLSYNEVPGVSHLRIQPSGSVQIQQFPLDVSVMGQDSRGQIWCGGIDGLTLIAANGTTRNINHSDGLIWDDTSPMGFWEETNGNILIATSRGLAHYAPHGESFNWPPPAVELTSVTLGGQDRTHEPHPIVDHNHASFAVQFTPLTLRNPDKVECRYRLTGLESDFTETMQRELRYAALPAGEYQLLVQCREGVSGWSARSAIFTFKVMPPWWQTWWARLASFLLLVAFVWGVVALRTRSIDTRRKELEAAVAERSGELLKKNLELQEISLTDPLTRARNRRYFYETIAADVSQVGRAFQRAHELGTVNADHRDLVFIMVDLDYFKSVNDKFGHAAGDRLLQDVASRLHSAMRRSDEMVRWGGEEFLILCRSTERAQIPTFCARILEIIAEEPFDLGSGRDVWMTCSIGWTPYPWLRTDVNALGVEDVTSLADKAMYCAKRFGRNQSVGLLPSDEAIASIERISLEKVGDVGQSPLVKVVKTQIDVQPEVWNP